MAKLVELGDKIETLIDGRVLSGEVVTVQSEGFFARLDTQHHPESFFPYASGGYRVTARVKTELENQIANLETVREYIDGYADIEDIDGETGRTIPNKAMRACSMIDEIIRDLEKLTEGK